MKLTLSGFISVHIHSLTLILMLNSILFCNLEPVQAQTQQPLVIAARASSSSSYGSVALLRDDTTGALTLLPNSDAAFTQDCFPFVAEPRQTFLYGYCADGLSMYSLDGSS